jgi:sugar (pentulose or hexulose) kinase
MLRLAGRGTTDPGWRQMLSDILGLPLGAVDVSAASGLGAAALAACAAELTGCPKAPAPRLVADPDDDRLAIYRERHRRFREKVLAIRDQRSTGAA